MPWRLDTNQLEAHSQKHIINWEQLHLDIFLEINQKKKTVSEKKFKTDILNNNTQRFL